MAPLPLSWIIRQPPPRRVLTPLPPTGYDPVSNLGELFKNLPHPSGSHLPQSCRDGRAYSKTAHGLTDGSPAWGDSQDLSSSVPSMTPVRSQSERTRSVKTPDHRPLSYGTHGSLSPAPTISTFSQEPDQPFSLRNLSLTSNREPGYINRNNTVALAVGSPSPARSRKTASNSPGIHPHLAAISMAQSSLSKKGN